jgi:uncharacterized protein (TIGR00369 family)
MSTMLENAQRIIAGEAPASPSGRLIGSRLTAIEPGRAQIELDTDGRHFNPMGTVHGGIICEIADSAMGLAFASTLPEGESFTTLELKINFLRAVRIAHLTASGVVVSRGKTVGLAECEVRDEEGRLVAKASSTCLTLRGEQARGR